mmetsp:Transcript_1347/g.1482  ORF Transcript_1347/g.1482 Transcript_1347/m.1482 type:complete len:500 (-) Transcript_1347:231-1730(-)
MRTLVGFNIFTTPQEKKIKLEIKRHTISGLIEKLSKNSTTVNLRSIVALCTSLILLRKLLSTDDNIQTLFYNKENVAHTIKELKADNKIFKALAELMKSTNPLSPEAEVINPLLVPLIERMTFAEDAKADPDDGQPLLEDDEASESASRQEEDMNIDEDSPAIEIEIEIDGEPPAAEDEEDEDEPEGEDDNSAAEPFVEDNATESENLSLDDMIQELEYAEGDEESESGSDEDQDNSDEDDEMEGDQEAEDDEDALIEDQNVDSDEASELVEEAHRAALMGLIEDQDDEGIDELESLPVQNDDRDGFDVLNVIEIEENDDRPNILPRGNVLDFNQFDDGDISDVRFHHLLNMIHRRDRDRAPLFFERINRARPDGNNMNFYNAAGRPRRANDAESRRGLEALYADAGYNDNEFWDTNIIANPTNNRNRASRMQDDPFSYRDSFTNFLQRDINDLRERIEEGALGMRGRARDNKDSAKAPTSPFEVLRKFQLKDKEPTES